jgi:hypothetical protein
MPLMNIHPNILLDPESVAFVQFENMSQDPTAFLRFKDGSFETVTGEAASRLQERLNQLDEPQLTESISRSPDSENGGPLGLDYQSVSVTMRKPDGSVETSGLQLLPVTQFVQRKKAWFYRKETDGKAYILAFVSAKGSCSVRSFTEDGIFLRKHSRAGNYQDAFSNLIDGAVELTANSQPNLERDCKERLPDALLAYLRKQT